MDSRLFSCDKSRVEDQVSLSVRISILGMIDFYFCVLNAYQSLPGREISEISFIRKQERKFSIGNQRSRFIIFSYYLVAQTWKILLL